MPLLLGDLKRKVEFTCKQYQDFKPPLMITGRDIVWRIYGQNKFTEYMAQVNKFQRFIGLRLIGDNLGLSLSQWDECLYKRNNKLPDYMKEHTFRANREERVAQARDDSLQVEKLPRR